MAPPEDTTDQHDDDCILKSLKYKSKHKHNLITECDDVYKENPLLAEFIEKCINLEGSGGMLKVINNKFLGLYKELDADFKASPEFETMVKSTMVHLDRDPLYRFTHIKDLCVFLQTNKIKKRVQLTTLATNISEKRSNLSVKEPSDFEKVRKIRKNDTIVVNKIEDVSMINLDNYINSGTIDDANDNSDQDDGKKNQICHDEKNLVTHNVSQNIIISDDERVNHASKENDSNIEDELLVPLKIFSNKNVIDDSHIIINDGKENHAVNDNECLNEKSDENLIVPENISEYTDAPNGVDMVKVKAIEQKIAAYKQILAVLDEEEITDDNVNSPYLRSDKYQAKIVCLYKELCRLTGAKASQRCEVRLEVIEGHPSGPVKRLEKFLNCNIDNNGNLAFPDLPDVIECVLKANEEDNLGWTNQQIMREATALFTRCGHALQKRRQRREWEDLLSKVKNEDCDMDPADNDPELMARLEANRRLAEKKEADILERYSTKQNTGFTKTTGTHSSVATLCNVRESMNDSVNSCSKILTPNKNKLIVQNKKNRLTKNKVVNASNKRSHKLESDSDQSDSDSMNDSVASCSKILTPNKNKLIVQNKKNRLTKDKVVNASNKRSHKLESDSDQSDSDFESFPKKHKHINFTQIHQPDVPNKSKETIKLGITKTIPNKFSSDENIFQAESVQAKQTNIIVKVVSHMPSSKARTNEAKDISHTNIHYESSGTVEYVKADSKPTEDMQMCLEGDNNTVPNSITETLPDKSISDENIIKAKPLQKSKEFLQLRVNYTDSNKIRETVTNISSSEAKTNELKGIFHTKNRNYNSIDESGDNYSVLNSNKSNESNNLMDTDASAIIKYGKSTVKTESTEQMQTLLDELGDDYNMPICAVKEFFDIEIIDSSDEE